MRTHDSKHLFVGLGPLIVSVEPLYWHTVSYRHHKGRPPLTERTESREVEDRFRIGHGRAVRLPFTKLGIAVGWWQPAADALEEEVVTRLAKALGGDWFNVPMAQLRKWAVLGASEAPPDTPGVQAVSTMDAALVARTHEDPELDGWLADQGLSLVPWNGDAHDLVLQEQRREEEQWQRTDLPDENAVFGDLS